MMRRVWSAERVGHMVGQWSVTGLVVCGSRCDRLAAAYDREGSDRVGGLVSGSL